MLHAYFWILVYDAAAQCCIGEGGLCQLLRLKIVVTEMDLKFLLLSKTDVNV